MQSEEDKRVLGGGKLPGNSKNSLHLRFNLEYVRCAALFASVFMNFMGWVMNEIHPGYPNGNPKDTWIYKFFHFNHICSFLDFNPSKSVVAPIGMTNIILMDIFCVLAYFTTKFDYENGLIDRRFWKYSQFTFIFGFIFSNFFIMVFVNSPTDPDVDHKGLFILHYIPFMFNQTANVFMSIQQCILFIQKDIIPFGIHKTTLKIYSVCISVMLVFYTLFVVTQLADIPMWTSQRGSAGNVLAQIMMWTYFIIMAPVPAIMSYGVARNGEGEVTIDFADAAAWK